MIRLLLIALLLITGGCLHEIKIIPYCEGTPAKTYPCISPCKVKVFAAVPTEELIPNAIVIKDHLGITRCQAVS